MIKYLKMTPLCIFFGLFIGFSGTTAYGDTPVSGNIMVDTTWIKINSPYIVTGTVQVYPNITLSIEPGVVIKFNQNARLQIGGELIAKGLETDPIIFAANTAFPTPGFWGGIEFAEGSIGTTFDNNSNYLSGSIFEHCIIEYGSNVYNDGISARCNVFVTKSTLTSSGINMGLYKNQNLSDDTLILIRQNKINDGFIRVEMSYFNGGKIDILDNLLTKSSISVTYDRGQSAKITHNHLVGGIIRCYQGDGALNEGVNIDSNIIESNKGYSEIRNYGGAIVITGGNFVSISNNIIQENEGGLSGGIYCGGVETLDIGGNTIRNNISNPDIFGIRSFPPSYAGGLNISNSVNVIIHDNSIAGNKGMLAPSGAISILYAASPTINKNDILDNSQYDLYNASSTEINAMNNWWGTTDLAIIGQHIFDYYDDFTKGKVSYLPVASSPFFKWDETYSVTASVIGGYGTATPATQTINYGSSATINITPDTGYQIASITDNGQNVAIVNPYVISNVTATHAVVVTFAINIYAVTASVTGGHGAATPTTQEINHGANASINITPEPGYHIASITDNGMSQTIVNPYVISNVTGTHNVVVTFAINQYSVTVTKTSTGEGTITSIPSGIDCGSTCYFLFNYGTVITLAAQPATGSIFTGWTGCVSSNGNLCTFTMMTDKSVTAIFTINT